jgi:hypothetical protein
VSRFGQRLLTTGAVIEMRRTRHTRDGLIGLAIVLLIVGAGWGLMIWLNLR